MPAVNENGFNVIELVAIIDEVKDFRAPKVVVLPPWNPNARSFTPSAPRHESFPFHPQKKTSVMRLDPKSVRLGYVVATKIMRCDLLEARVAFNADVEELRQELRQAHEELDRLRAITYAVAAFRLDGELLQ